MKGSALTLKEIGRVRRAMRPLLTQYRKQADLAAVLGCSQQHLSAVFSGMAFPGIRFALGVAKATGQTLEALLTTPSASSTP